MIPKNIKEIMQKLLDAGFEAFLLGGGVRDIVLGLKPKDYDIFTNAPAEKILKIFPKGRVIGNEERQKKILTVVVGDVEVSRYRGNGDRTEYGETLEQHTSTCDLTINSIAMTINGNIIDYQGGMKDLKNRVLRSVGNPTDRFNEDLLRILRLIRFQLKYNFMIESSTMIGMHDTLEKLLTLPPERLREELLLVVRYPNAIQRLIDYNILQEVIPEIKELSIEGGDHHDETVLQHSVNAFNVASTVTDNSLLKLAAFFHDIGKGKTYEKVDGKVHYYEHDKVGEEIVNNIMSRLKFSTDDKRYVKGLVRTHMFSLKQDGGNISKKTYIKFFAKLEAAKVPIEDYVVLLYADNQGNEAKPRIKYGDFIKGNDLHKKYYKFKHEKEPFSIKDLEIDGKDLMKMGLKAGPKIGDVLQQLYDKVMDGDVKNVRPELMNKAKELVKK